MPAEYVRDILSVMMTCGMYDFSGEWTYRVGLPAKSLQVCEDLAGQFGLHSFEHSSAKEEFFRRLLAARQER